jgi:hypothetical protein
MAVLLLLVWMAILLGALLAPTGWLSDAQIVVILLLILVSVTLLPIWGLRIHTNNQAILKRAMVMAVELDDALGDRGSFDVGWERYSH